MLVRCNIYRTDKGKEANNGWRRYNLYIFKKEDNTEIEARIKLSSPIDYSSTPSADRVDWVLIAPKKIYHHESDNKYVYSPKTILFWENMDKDIKEILDKFFLLKETNEFRKALEDMPVQGLLGYTTEI